MKRVKNEKDFKVFRVSIMEAHRLGWGDICDQCNDMMSGDRMFIPVLCQRCLCPECYNEWINKTTHYEEDIPYENREAEDFERTVGNLGMEIS